MLIKKSDKCSGFFQIQKGKLQYIDPKINDFFEINAKMVQALIIKEQNNNLQICALEIIGNFEILKTIQLPLQFAQDVKYWLYIHLHFLSREDSSKAHKDVQPIEVIQYRKNQRIRSFLFSLIVILLITGLSRSVTYSFHLEKLKAEAQKSSYSDLMEESRIRMDNKEFSESIHSLLLANVLKPSQSVRNFLNIAYLARGKYYLSVENIPYAKKDFQSLIGSNQEAMALLLKIEEFERKKWLRFSDFTDLVQFSWKTVFYNLDHGKNKDRTNELDRTWSEFQEKFIYTRNNSPLLQQIKNIFIAYIY
jgi:hypothetical protein